VLTGLARSPVARTEEELTAIVADAAMAETHLAGFHPAGTARMGADAGRAPVDTSGRLRGVDGVYVADASDMPACRPAGLLRGQPAADHHGDGPVCGGERRLTGWPYQNPIR
jgi:hypothetical protein